VTPSIRGYVVRETLISVVINSLLSALFVWLAFGGVAAVAVWGEGGLAFDFIPQTFMISLMSVLVPTLLTRKRRRAGAVDRCEPVLPWLPRNVILRAVSIAIAATLVFSSAGAFTLAAAIPGPVPILTVAAFKIAYGALVAVIVTPLGLCIALGEEVSK
jgi:hypothetical protein